MVLLVTYFSRFKLVEIYFKKKSLAFMRARDINSLLGFLTRCSRPFPVPYQLIGLDQLSHESGMVLCTVHLPLIKVTLRGIMDSNIKIDWAIVAVPSKDMKMAVWGITEKIPVLLRSPSVLLKAKTRLLQNESIVLMIDNPSTGVYSKNILLLCNKVHAKLVFFFAEYTPGGLIEARIFEAPHPYCDSMEAIDENLKFLRQKSEEILERYKGHSVF
jgi:hypothetical protein